MPVACVDGRATALQGKTLPPSGRWESCVQQRSDRCRRPGSMPIEARAELRCWAFDYMERPTTRLTWTLRKERKDGSAPEHAWGTARVEVMGGRAFRSEKPQGHNPTVINYGAFAQRRPAEAILSTALIPRYLRVNRSAD